MMYVTTFPLTYAFCFQSDNIREETKSDALESDFSNQTGLDPEYSPARDESSSSDEELRIMCKPSSEESSDDEAHEGRDGDLREDKDQLTGKCNIKKCNS